MKRKVVVKAQLDSDKDRSNAIKLSVQVYGVLSATIDRNEGLLTVVGEGIHAEALIEVLRSGGRRGKLMAKIIRRVQSNCRVRSASIVSVEDVKEEEKGEEKKEEKKEEEKKEEQKDGSAEPCPVPCGTYPYWSALPPVILVEEAEPDGCRLC